MKNNTARKVKQIPSRYLLVGIDPHKKKHAAVLMTQDYVVHSKFKFNDSREGYEESIKRVRMEMLKNDCRGAMFAIETAGHYWRNFAYYLNSQGVPFRLINQFTLKRRREGKELNRRKNDFRDAEVAAQLLLTGEFTETKLPEGVYAELRASYTTYRRLVKEKARIINLNKGLLDNLFPEFAQVFKDFCGITAMSVLSTCSIPKNITEMSEEKFIDLIRNNHQGRLARSKLVKLYQLAQTSVGIKEGAESVHMEVSFLVQRLGLLKHQIVEMENHMVELVNETEEGKYLLSIIGLNYVAVAGLLAEIGSFKAYQSAKQLIKMAGSNPTESESAGKRKQRTPMSKKGRPGLRHCAWTVVIPMLRHNPDFRAWSQKLRDRPAHANPLTGKRMIGAGVNKLLRLVFALVKHQEYYRVSQPIPVAI